MIWVETTTDVACRTTAVMLRYHLLWELTHVCFEHPGLLVVERAECDRRARASPVLTRARWRRVAVAHEAGVGAHGRRRETIDISLVGAVVPGDLVLVHAGTAIAVLETGVLRDQGTDFLYPFIDADERDAGSLLVDLAASAEAKGRERSAARGHARPRRLHTPRPRAMAAGSTKAAVCSRSATAAAPPTPRHRRAVPSSAAGAASRPAVSSKPAVLTALANDVGFELVFSRQIIAQPTRRHRARLLDERRLGERAPCLRRGGATRAADDRARGQPRRCDGASAVDHCLVVRADSVHRIQEAQAALGSRCGPVRAGPAAVARRRW